MEKNIGTIEATSESRIGVSKELDNRIKLILEKNKFRKINGKDIQEQLQVEGILTSCLMIRKSIRQLRKEGKPIIANPIGYKWCDLSNENDRKELGEYIESRRLELRDESITINKLSQVLSQNVCGGQNV